MEKYNKEEAFESDKTRELRLLKEYELITSKLDEFFDELDNLLESRRMEIVSMPLEKKRIEARKTTDRYVLSILMKDESMMIRYLLATNPNLPIELMEKIMEDSDEYMRMILANNPKSPIAILEKIFNTNPDYKVLVAIRNHKNVTPELEQKVKRVMS
jgi:hypothetical protein